MRPHIPKSLKERVIKRALSRCEYCLFNSNQSFLPFHIEHIIAVKHGGQSNFDNLAYACPQCNANKGTDLATVFLPDIKLIKIFDPRRQKWNDHFYLEDGKILAKTKTGKATIKLLKVNEPERLQIKKILASIGLYP